MSDDDSAFDREPLIDAAGHRDPPEWYGEFYEITVSPKAARTLDACLSARVDGQYQGGEIAATAHALRDRLRTDVRRADDGDLPTLVFSGAAWSNVYGALHTVEYVDEDAPVDPESLPLAAVKAELRDAFPTALTDHVETLESNMDTVLSQYKTSQDND